MKAEKIIRQLKERKFRITPDRTGIISILCTTHSPISAELLVKKIKCNKTTAYRELDFLQKNSVVQEVDFADGIKRYELNDLNHHHHLICVKCKSVQDIVLKENMDGEESRILRLKKFHVSKHNLEFFGYCQNCIA
jgi:Fur family transcriptional regulator, ferric uptake regulator